MDPGTTVADMEIQSIDRGRRPQRVQNAACSAHGDLVIRCDQRAAAHKFMRVPLIHDCMASALGPVDVRPDFHVQSSTTNEPLLCL